MSVSPQSKAKRAAIAFLKEARAAGWARTKIEYRPDGSLIVDVSISEPEGDDDFISADLRMGK